MRCNSLPTRAFQVAERSGKDIIGLIEWPLFVGCLLSVRGLAHTMEKQ